MPLVFYLMRSILTGLGLHLLIFTVPAILSGCQAMYVYRNYPDIKPASEVAVLRERGYRFWLEDNRLKSPADELWLVPGEYMIRFMTQDREGGAAFCIVNQGRHYRFRLTDRQYLPKTHSYAFVGECFRDDETGPTQGTPSVEDKKSQAR